MSLEEFFDWLLQTGMGWLGWTEEQTLSTSMPGIVLAREGRIDMLGAIFGKGEPKEGGEAAPRPSPPAQEFPEMTRKEVSDGLKTALRTMMPKEPSGWANRSDG